ncbi:MFS transporter [Undibacterium sp. LX15W]|uniref:MFS transporter n=1 Tax=Undibacterium flavidum TaxID=2762297 RepID=A0ABR6YD25_9BURK|nr:MFS transporter [Undibacterium flavidum]
MHFICKSYLTCFIEGGYIADRILGYQHSILLGAVFMSIGLFLIAYPDPKIFKLGLATIIIGNGLFKPNISTLVGKLYDATDSRRDIGFTIFYMGINTGGCIAPLFTGLLAEKIFGSSAMPAYKAVFIAGGFGMVMCLVWFSIGRRMLKGIGRPMVEAGNLLRLFGVTVGVLIAIPVTYALLSYSAGTIQWVLGGMFIALSVALLVEGFRNGKVARDKVLAMLCIFTFNIIFFMFFEQAGSSFTFLASDIVDRNLNGFIFPTGWFQSVNSLVIVLLAPVVAGIWIFLTRRKMEVSVPQKFALGLIGNALAFGLLMFVLSSLVDANNKIPFWSLIMVYVFQSIGELCLSPIGLSMVTKLAPVRLVGLGMGGWFLSTGIGNNLSGIFAGYVSGTNGLSIASALQGYTFGFYSLLGAGIFLLLIAHLVQKLMHGVK